eukprot:scaffold1220_cov117-Isochrysis_galbana.AAC.7
MTPREGAKLTGLQPLRCGRSRCKYVSRQLERYSNSWFDGRSSSTLARQTSSLALKTRRACETAPHASKASAVHRPSNCSKTASGSAASTPSPPAMRRSLGPSSRSEPDGRTPCGCGGASPWAIACASPPLFT